MAKKSRQNLIIDGYNLIEAAPEMFAKMPSLEGRRKHLLKLLVSTPRLRDSDILVVFDGKSPSNTAKKYSFRGIRVKFSGNQQEADQIIQHIIRTEASSKNLTVVSSDREILNTARDHRAQTLTAQEFWKRNRKISVTDKNQNNSAANHQPDLTKREVKEWLKIFKQNRPGEDEI
ncbi:MAG: NYN domain-containing protein [bacterium]|nr:MAG: NYN domain-containing protein [bacterium]